MFSYHGQAPWTATAASLQLFRRTHRGRNGLSRSSTNDNDLHLKQWTYIQRFLQRESSVNYSTPQKDQTLTASFLLTIKLTL